MVFERILIVALACSAPACADGAACDEKRKPGSCFRLEEAIRARTAAWTQADTVGQTKRQTEGQAEGQTKGQTGADRGTHRGVQDEWKRNLKTQLATG